MKNKQQDLQLQAALMREAKVKMKELASKKESQNEITNGKVLTTPRPFLVNSIRDIKKASKMMIEDLINKSGRFTVAEARVLKDMVEIWKTSDEYLKVTKKLKAMEAAERAQGR